MDEFLDFKLVFNEILKVFPQHTAHSMTDDLQSIATDLNLSTDQVEKTVQLLDVGNTIPFITRFRKDETGGLRASQIQAIQFAINKQRALAERKTFVIKSIDSQNKLDEALKSKIEAAQSSRELEDLYLPFKPQTAIACPHRAATGFRAIGQRRVSRGSTRCRSGHSLD